jgi:hypothetical protein
MPAWLLPAGWMNSASVYQFLFHTTLLERLQT